MSNYVKEYDLGNIRVDIPNPIYIHELPLLSFKDFNGGVNVELVYNSNLKENNTLSNFNINPGYKLNIEKKIIFVSSTETKFIDSDGSIITLGNLENVNAFNDDSQRIIRKVGSNYELENSDFSKEVYTETGLLSIIYDKYGTEYLRYNYEGSTLKSITYRNSKEVVFTYESGKLKTISYGGTTSTFEYDNADYDVRVKHYTQVNFSTKFANSVYSVKAMDASTPNVVIYSKECYKDLYDIILTEKEGDNVVDTMTYTFYYTQGKVIDITNKKGVTIRHHYQSNRLLYSYEVHLNENESIPGPSFTGSQFEGVVNMYNTLECLDENFASGKLTINDGVRLSVNNLYGLQMNLSNVENQTGYYLLTGWVSAENTYLVKIVIYNPNNEQIEYFYVPLDPINKRHFFAYKFHTTEQGVYVRCVGDSTAELFDVKMSYLSTMTTDSEGDIVSMMQETVLMKKTDIASGNTTTKIPISKANFQYTKNGEVQVDQEIKMNDLIKYNLNIKRGGNSNEIYMNNCRWIDIATGGLKFIYLNELRNVTDYYIGTRYYDSGCEYWTYIDFDQDNIKIYYFKDDGLILTKEYNSLLDLLNMEKDYNKVSYIWTDGHITETNVYHNTYLLSSSMIYYEDRVAYRGFNFEYEVYYIDSVWGNIYKVETTAGTTIVNSFDDDKSVLTKKEFGLGTNNIQHNLGYNKGYLSSLENGGLKYDLSYIKGKLTKVEKYQNNTTTPKITLEEITHTDNSVTYNSSNFYTATYNFDKYDRLSSITDVLENVYTIDPDKYHREGSCPDNINSYLTKQVDKKTNITSKFYYNSLGELIEIDKINSSNALVSKETYAYDSLKRLTTDVFEYNSSGSKKSEFVVNYLRGKNNFAQDNRVTSFNHILSDNSTCTSKYYYGMYDRLASKTYTIDDAQFSKAFEYGDTVITKESNNIADDVVYEYARNNKIQKIRKGSKDIIYYYDEYDRVVREDNECLDKTIVYEYNEIGNITSKKTYAHTNAEVISTTPSTKTFTYDTTNVDRLLSCGSLNITYNSLGYPLTYNGYNLTWSNGKLTSMTKGNRTTGIQRHSFTYNALGQRIGKSYMKTYAAGGITSTSPTDITNMDTVYTYDNQGRLISEVTTTVYYSNESDIRTIEFIYDQNSIIGMKYSSGTINQKYYFNRNILGDVTEIYDTSGNLVVKYNYDAYGVCTIGYETTNSQIATYNPIRYRGYYYDQETNLALVSSRYYSPELGRFIQPADVSSLNPQSINGLNLYTYAFNNPIGVNYNSSASNGGNIIDSVKSSNNIGIPTNKHNNINSTGFGFDPNFLGNVFSHHENIFAGIAGVFEVQRTYHNLPQIETLAKISKVLMHAGFWLNIGLSAYNNYHDNSLTKQEKWVSFIVDSIHTTGQTVGSYFLGGIPYAGPFLAICVPIVVDYLWSGELSIIGFDINVKPILFEGKTLEEWVKYWVNSWFD